MHKESVGKRADIQTICRPSVPKRLPYILLDRWLWFRDSRQTGRSRAPRWQGATFCRGGKSPMLRVNDHRNERFSRDKAFDSNSIIAELPQLARPNAASAKIEVH